MKIKFFFPEGPRCIEELARDRTIDLSFVPNVGMTINMNDFKEELNLTNLSDDDLEGTGYDLGCLEYFEILEVFICKGYVLLWVDVNSA